MKHGIMVIFCLFGLTLLGQTDDYNLEKYWRMRHRFVEEFIKIGPNQGESLPAGRRKPCHTIDNTNFSATCFGEMHWGDGTMRHGYYLTMLATEYALLQKNNQDVTGTLNELYYALNALNRLDRTAENILAPLYGISLPEDLNGFYLREDVGEDFCQNWDNDEWDMEGTNSAYYHNNNSENLNNQSGWTTRTNNYQNTPSLDQMTSLLVGLRMVYEFVKTDNQGDIFVQPTPSDVGFNIRQETINITDRLVRFAADNNWFIIDVHGWPVNNEGGDLALTSYPIVEAAKKITGNSLNTGQVYNGVWRRRFIPYGTMQACFTGKGGVSDDPGYIGTQCTKVNTNQLIVAAISATHGVPGLHTEYVISKDLLEEFGSDPGPNNSQDQSAFLSWQDAGPLVGNVGFTSGLWNSIVPTTFLTSQQGFFNNHPSLSVQLHNELFGPIANGEDEPFVEHYNYTIVFNLGVAAGLWDQSITHNWGNITGNRALELINALLRDENPVGSKAFYKDFLDGMSMIGPYNLKGMDAQPGITYFDTKKHDNDWSTSYRWTHKFALDNGVDFQSQGIYSGLDYMVLHNLYRLIFDDEIITPFEEHYTCLDANPIVKPLTNLSTEAANNSLNNKLTYLDVKTKNVFDQVAINDNVYGTFNIEPFFPYYSDINITPPKFQTKHTTIKDEATVNVKTDFVICNAKTLTIEPSGTLIIQHGDVVAKQFAEIDLYGTLIIKKGARLNLLEQSKLILRPGAKVIIEDEGTFLLNHGSSLEYHEGGEIIMNGANSEFIQRSSVKMMTSGNFKINHIASTESGRYIIDNGNTSGVGFVKDPSVTGAC